METEAPDEKQRPRGRQLEGHIQDAASLRSGSLCLGLLIWGADGEEKCPRRQGADATSTGADPGLEDKGVHGTSSFQEHQNSEAINSSFLGETE